MGNGLAWVRATGRWKLTQEPNGFYGGWKLTATPSQPTEPGRTLSQVKEFLPVASLPARAPEAN